SAGPRRRRHRRIGRYLRGRRSPSGGPGRPHGGPAPAWPVTSARRPAQMASRVDWYTAARALPFQEGRVHRIAVFLGIPLAAVGLALAGIATATESTTLAQAGQPLTIVTGQGQGPIAEEDFIG